MICCSLWAYREGPSPIWAASCGTTEEERLANTGSRRYPLTVTFPGSEIGVDRVTATRRIELEHFITIDNRELEALRASSRRRQRQALREGRANDLEALR